MIVDVVARRTSYDRAVNCAYGGTRTSLNEYISVLQEVVGRSLQVGHTPPRAGDVRDSQSDTTRLQELFPSIQPIPLREGMHRTVEWYRVRADRS